MWDIDQVHEEDVDIYWEDFCQDLGEHFKKKFKSFCAKVSYRNLGWRNTSGTSSIEIPETLTSAMGRDLIQRLAPKSGDFTVQVYSYKNGLEFRIKHHDNPVNGDEFYLTPIAQSSHRNCKYRR